MAILDQHGKPYISAAAIFGDALRNEQTGMGMPGYDPSLMLEYTMAPFLTQYQVENAFINSFIMGRMIELPAQHQTREWRTIKIAGDEKGKQVDAITAAELSLNVKATFTEGIMWGDLYGGALMVMGIDGQNLDEPLDVESVTMGSLSSVTVIDRWQVTASSTFTNDPTDPNFRYPEYYSLITDTEGQINIHSSRCIRFDGTRLPRLTWLRNGRWHGSVIQRVLEVIKGFEASIKASSKALQEGSVDVYKVEGLYERLMDADGQLLIKNRIKLAADLKSVYRALIIDAKDNLDRQPINVSGYDELLAKHQDMVCGATEMPSTVLFGRPPQGMDATGESDTRNWYDTLSIKQEFKLRPLISQFDQVLVRHALGYFPDDYSFDFNPLWQMDDQEEALTAFNVAQARNLYMSAGCLKPETVAADLLAEKFSVSLTEEDVQELEEYNEPILPKGPTGLPIDPQQLIQSMTGVNQPGVAKPGQPALPAPKPVRDAGKKARNGRR